MGKIRNTLKRIDRFSKLKKFVDHSSLIKISQKRYEPGIAKTTLGNIAYADGPTFLAGMEEIFIKEIYKIASFRNEQSVVVDCGANIGLASLYFNKINNAKVYAIEADPNIYKLLKANSQLADAHKIEPINKAVWTDDNGVNFDIEGGFSGQIHLHGHELVKESIKIPSLRLRDYILGLEKVDFLKLDIEGAENEVIPDCQDFLKDIDYLFIEYHSNQYDRQRLGDILNILTEKSFRYHIHEAFTSPHPFSKVDILCNMDLQLNIFATNKAAKK